ncbi:hypothetical protein D3C77_504660 [compost metagenome]
MHLQLIEAGLDHLNRVFDGAQVDLRGGQVLERGVQSAGLAGTGGAGDQDQAVTLANQRLPTAEVVAIKAKLGEVLLHKERVEDA